MLNIMLDKGEKWRLDKLLTGKNVDEVTFCNYKPACFKVNRRM